MANRILVGMLACGENERDQAVAALRAQTYRDYEYFLIENQPNKQAHEALYSRFMASAEQFDVFFKLDADMVLRRPTALAEVSGFFDKNRDVGLLLFELIDWYSDSLIPGIVITRNTARWPAHGDKLMVDSVVAVQGKHVRVSDRNAALAVHSPDPSPLQAFRFGVHRALKAMQDDRGSEDKYLDKAAGHWELLAATWRNFRVQRDRRMGLAVAGAEWILREGGSAAKHNYMGPEVNAEFARHQSATAESLYAQLGDRWDDESANRRRWEHALKAT